MMTADGVRRLPLVRTGAPLPFRTVMPAYLAALAGWLAASIVLVIATPALVDGAIASTDVVLAAHLVALVLFPFGVAAAVMQLLPMLLRNDLSSRTRVRIALILIAAGAPLAFAIARDANGFVAIFAALLALGLALVLVEVALLIRRVPKGRLIIVNRPAVALAVANALLAFALGAAAAADRGPNPLGIPYERLLLAHLSIALIGWLTVMIAVIGRTLVPMIGLGPAPARRRVPVAELMIVAGLWLYLAGVILEWPAMLAAGIVVAVAGLVPVGWLFARTALRGRIGVREGPGAHAAAGLVFLLQAALLGLVAAAGSIDGRRAAIAAVAFLGLGWAAGMIVGHIGKLLSFAAWGAWPPGPRPRQSELYPRLPWQFEALLFTAAVELLGGGIVFESDAAARAGALLLVAAALAATLGAMLTISNVLSLLRRHPVPAAAGSQGRGSRDRQAGRSGRQRSWRRNKTTR